MPNNTLKTRHYWQDQGPYTNQLQNERDRVTILRARQTLPGITRLLVSRSHIQRKRRAWLWFFITFPAMLWIVTQTIRYTMKH